MHRILITVLLLFAALEPCISINGIIARIPDDMQNPMPMSRDRILSGRTPDCDDGKTDLTVDWNKSISDYGCFEPRWSAQPAKVASDVCMPLPPPQAFHKCMSQTITYSDPIPSWGDHRPSWPQYGEYTYLPPQRWLHSLEHGAVVLLYHPCANTTEIEKLRSIVTGCLRRHVISPSNKLTKETPFALVTWGCKILLNSADEMTAVSFILKHAKHGAEEIEIDGQYNDQLKWPAQIVSDIKDSFLCPKNVQNSLFIQKILM